MSDREQIHVWLDSELLEKFDKKRNGLDRTFVIRKLIDGWTKDRFEIDTPR